MNVTARSRRVPLTGATLAVAALLAAGCGASSSSGAASAPASAASTPAQTATSAAPASTATSSGSGTSASGGSACATSDLNVSIGGTQGAAGSVYTTIDFTNTGSGACTLYGYPGVSLVDSSAGQLGAAATRNPSHSPTRVTLAPGAKANAVVQVAAAGNYPASECKPTPASSLRIYPPDQTQPLKVSYKTTGCSKSTVKLLSVSVVTAGG